MLHRARHCEQASSLVKAKNDVGALDRLARSTLAQIVDGARRHQHACTLVERKANLGGIGTDDRSRLGLLAGIEHAHKGATGVKLLVMVDDILKNQRVESRGASGIVTVESRPRLSGAKCGVKTMRSARPSICSISGV